MWTTRSIGAQRTNVTKNWVDVETAAWSFARAGMGLRDFRRHLFVAKGAGQNEGQHEAPVGHAWAVSWAEMTC
jgi:hypothetical protein